MKIAIPKELAPENRVAMVPNLVKELNQLGLRILLEKDAGLSADCPDKNYDGVDFYQDSASMYQNADIIIKVQPPSEDEIRNFKKESILICFLYPIRYPERIAQLNTQNVISFAMESIPRISRAQSMDALSSQASAAGYKATLIAANSVNRFFPMLTTAAGTIRPINVLVIGTGVAGLQAIATARRLGAIVKAYDIRPATKEQVESLGAKMIDIGIQADATGGYARELTEEEKQKQQLALSDAITKADVVITTALIPNKPAPKIITRSMVESMSRGSVIVDAAAEAGGNCELTEPGKTVEYNGITLHAPMNLPSMLARDASNMYAKNVLNFLKLLVKEQKLSIDWDDPIIAQSCITGKKGATT